MSAREIEDVAHRAIEKESLKQRSLARVNPAVDLEANIFKMSRLGSPAGRIRARQDINRLTALNYVRCLP